MAYNTTKYYFYKLPSDFYRQDEVKWLMKQKNGYEILTIYQQLIFETINKNGFLINKIGSNTLAYDIKDLAYELRHDEDIMKDAIEKLKYLNMITIKDGYDFIEDAVNLTAQTKGALYTQLYRKEKADKSQKKCKDNCQTDIEIDKEKEKEKEIDIELDKDIRKKKKEKDGDKKIHFSNHETDFFEEALGEI